MIDFRYHLVSLVSVFLALAVGIVLGAGPLKGGISDELRHQVDQLSTSKNDLAAELRTEQAALDKRDTFLGQVAPSLVASQLTGSSVVLVTLPGADADSVKSLTATLQSAGARVTGRVDLDDAWADPARAAERAELARTLRGRLPVAVAGPATPGLPATAPSSPSSPSPAASGSQDELAGQLGRALLTDRAAQAGLADPSTPIVLEALRSAGLASVAGELTVRADEAVVLVPRVAAATVNGPSPSASVNGQELAAWSGLLRALDRACLGTVALGPASAASRDGVLAAVRGDADLSSRVSSVDTGSTPMGEVTAVLALRDQRLGRSGSFGFVDPVTAVLPPLRAGAGQ